MGIAQRNNAQVKYTYVCNSFMVQLKRSLKHARRLKNLAS